MEWVFWISLAALGYIYLGYPLVVTLAARVRPAVVAKSAAEPRVSVVISAYNEVDSLEPTILNKLELNYPQDKLEVVVVSDGSTDGTDDVVRRLNAVHGDRVRLIRQEPRRGKTAALNLAIPSLVGDIVVFSDANSIFDTNALRALVTNFADPQVGYVTGRTLHNDRDASANSRGYARYTDYEHSLRERESLMGSVVGVDGGVDAVRKSLYFPMRHDQLPDFVLPLRVVQSGYRVVYEPSACAEEGALVRATDEYRMRVRVALRAMWALWEFRAMLNPARYGLFAWQLWSHKLMRYLAFLFLIGMAVSSTLLQGHGWVYALAGIVQTVFYGAGVVGMLGSERVRNLLNVPYYFLVVNVAAADAFFRFLNGRRIVVWQPRLG